MNYNRFLNNTTARMKPNPMMFIGEIARMNPDMISLANGRPDPDLFPFKEATFTLLDGSTISIDHVRMKRALQYSESTGFQELVQWLFDWQMHIHSPPSREGSARMTCMLSCGSLDGIYKSLECFVEEGDTILMEQPVYPGPATVLKAIGNLNIIPVYSDEQGLNSKNLRHVLSHWTSSDVKDPKSKIPKILYCTPSCANPTGVSMSLDRKKEIYEIAREYDLLILEDDAYFYLQFSEEFIPSFLSMDVSSGLTHFPKYWLLGLDLSLDLGR